MAITKVGPKYQVTIPKAAREAVGLDVGDLVDAIPQENGILLRPKTVVDKHPFIEARLREAEADIKAGRVSKAFDSVDDLLTDLNSTKRGRKKRIKKARE
jgi:AbrB family looped-hinge helix DNA binding protein